MERLIGVQSYDGRVVEVPVAVAIRSMIIKRVLDLYKDEPPSIVTGTIVPGDLLAKVFEYCTKHAEFEAANGNRTERELEAAQLDLERWDESFLNLPMAALRDLSAAANYMVVEDLLDKCCKKVARFVEGKSVEEIRTLLNIESDFTPDEEQQLREENSWAFG